MCLVISALLGALGVNFFINGFYTQAALMAVISLGFIALMIKNIRCRKNSCGLNNKKKTEDDAGVSNPANDLDLDTK